MVISVVGLGFVGLTTALGLASKGHKIYGIELDKTKRELLENKKLPFYEQHMQEKLEQFLNKNFFVQENQLLAVPESETIFYCVGTPFAEDGSADLTYIYEAINETMPIINSEKHPTLVIKSTVPVGTLKEKIVPMLEKQGYHPGATFELVNNPEFLREGRCWEDFINADRIVIGDFGNRGFENLLRVYKDFETPKFHVTPNTAEFIKYLSNTFLATIISYSNEMANFSNKIGDIEISKAFSILHDDRRWKESTMSDYVYPGCGYGGYCLPKDTQAMLCLGQKYGEEMAILNAVINTNSKMPDLIAGRITEGLTSKSIIGILGLAFKPSTDDVRDTSAAKIIKSLNMRGFNNILVFDLIAKDKFKEMYSDLDIKYCDSADEVVEKSDKVAIVTAWPEFVKYKRINKVLDFRYMRD